MSREAFARSELILGGEAMKKLEDARVIVFGVGGVGTAVCEGLARGGVGHITMVDPDTVSESNINRQLCALHSTIGKNKAQIMKERMLDINPDAEIIVRPVFFDESTLPQFDLSQYDFIADCIDTVSSKLLLIETAGHCHTPCISALGAGNKKDPTQFRVGDIYKTSVCPLARVLRRELKARGIKAHPVVYSEEVPCNTVLNENGRHAPGSLSFVPPVMGYIIAGEIIKAITSVV